MSRPRPTQGDKRIHQLLFTIFFEKLHIEVPAADTDLVETGVLDSLAFVNLLLCLEQDFGATVPIDELNLDNFRTLDQIAQCVVRVGGYVHERSPSAASAAVREVASRQPAWNPS